MPARWDNLTFGGASMRCFVATPEGRGPHPAVVVIQHAGGVDEFVQKMSERFAQAGFVALSPDLYHRDDSAAADDAMTRMSRLRDRTIIEDVNAAIAHARTLDEVRGDRVGITGFCMGGRVAYLMATQSDALRACVVFWGGNILTPWGQGESPFAMSTNIGCPILGIFGADDGNPNQADVAKIDAELTRLGKPHEFHSYAGAGHAFMNVGRPSYREEASNDAWVKCVEFFGRHLNA